MKLLSPRSIPPQKPGPFQAAFEVTKKLNYIIEENEFVIEKPIEIIYKSKPKSRLEAVIEAPAITNVVAETYFKFQNIINHCNNNAESLNVQLRDFLLTVKNLKQTKEELMAMDFMGLRNLFSDFLKAYTEIHDEERFNNTVKIKEITSIFFRYITDRNIYTHGTLKYRYNDKVFVMQYIENKKIKIYAELSMEILQSNLDTSKELMRIIDEVNKRYNKLKTIL